MPPPRRPAELGTRVLVAWRAPHPCSPTLLACSGALDDSACASFAQDGVTALIVASCGGHEGCVRLLLAAEAIEVNAKVSLEHALSQHMRWVRFHIAI